LGIIPLPLGDLQAKIRYKVKFTAEQVMKAQVVSRGIDLLFL